MILNNCINAEGLLILFGGVEPFFDNVTIQDVVITPGEIWQLRFY